MRTIYSICIPTYNRPDEVERFLHMFSEILKVDDLNKKVELCISDNNEDTKTKEIVNSYIKKGVLQIKYHYWGKNVGYDKNALKTFELATGEYLHYASDEVDYTQENVSKIVGILENEKRDGVYLNKKSKKIEDPGMLFNHMFSPFGIMNYFGTYMSSFIVKRTYYEDFIGEHRKDMEMYFGKAFMHLPLFVYFLQRAQRLSFSRIAMDTGKQAILLPTKKSELYIRNYYFLINACYDSGLINKKTLQKFKRNYLLVLPFLLFKIRMYMPPTIYEKEVDAVLRDIKLVEKEFSGISRLMFPLWQSLLFNRLIPYHLFYAFWHWYKVSIRRDPMTVDVFKEYEKKN